MIFFQILSLTLMKKLVSLEYEENRYYTNHGSRSDKLGSAIQQTLQGLVQRIIFRKEGRAGRGDG